MALITRVVTNVGDPLVSPDGTPLSGVPVLFLLVNAGGEAVNVFDAATGELVVGQTTAVTNSLGEFSVNLWPNDRGAINMNGVSVSTQYQCRIDLPGDITYSGKASVASGITSLLLVDFFAQSIPLTPVELSALQAHIADLTVHVVPDTHINIPALSGTYTLSATENRAGSFEAVSGLTGALTVIVQNTKNPFSAENLSPTYDVVFKTLAGSGVTVGPGITMMLYCNGTNCEPTAIGGAGTGDMVLVAAQTNSGIKTFLNGTFKLRNILNTFSAMFSSSATADRTYTLPDKDGDIALLSDVGGSSFDFFFTAVASDIGGYFSMTPDPSALAKSSVAVVVTGADIPIRTYATPLGQPGITTIVTGTHELHMHAAKTAGVAGAFLYGRLYKRDLAGIETLLVTSGNTTTLTGSELEYSVHFVVPAPDIALLSTDRLVVKIFATKTGVGTDPTVTMYAEDATASRIEVRSTIDALDNRYMRKSVYDADLDGIVDESERIGMLVRNPTASIITAGPATGWVYIDGAVGQTPTVALADADSEVASRNTIGVVHPTNLAVNGTGRVVTKGVIHNTNTGAFVDGDALWLSAGTSGTATTVRPAAPNHGVFLGWVAYAHAVNGIFVVDVQNGHEVNELHDVTITAIAAGQLLQRRSDNLVWENVAGKDQSGGMAGLTLFKLNMRNVLNTFTSFFTNSNTASRTYTLPDKDGTVVMTNDKLSAFAATTSDELAGVLTDETGSGGGFVRATSPTITSPTINGTVTAAFINRLTNASLFLDNIAHSTANIFGVTIGGGSHTESSGANGILNIKAVYNQTGTAGGIDLLIERTETSLGSGDQDFIECKVSAVDKFFVGNTGDVWSAGYVKSGSATGGIGYATGSGSTVVQATSRTTGVTLSYPNGEVTLVSAAGSATDQSFTVTNTMFAATDHVVLNQKSGTDKYDLKLTAKNAGNFEITFATTGGTTTEQPVISFAIIKGVSA